MSLPNHTLLSETFRVVAYRGGGGERPENTLEAFLHASALAPSVVLEMDVRRTVDGVLVAMHDDDVARTTGAVGKVSELRYDALAKFDAGFAFEQGGQFPYRERSLRIPKIDDVLGSVSGQCVVLDVHSDHPNIEQDVIALVRRHDAAGRVVIASEISRVIAQIRRQHPNWLFGGTSGQLLTRVLLERARLDALAPNTGGVLMIPEVHGALRVLSPRLVERAHRRGERVWVWVVESVADMRRLRALGVDGVFTPKPEEFLRAQTDLMSAAE
jgi:glycerophosphoryl diester phosphodiesterase